MTRSVVVVTGAEDVAAQFRRLGFKASDLSSAFERVGARVASDARSRAPRDSGRLASDIRSGGAEGVGKTRATISAGRAVVPYAGVHEYGWPRRNIAERRFMRDAADAQAQATADLLVAEMQRKIDSVGLG